MRGGRIGGGDAPGRRALSWLRGKVGNAVIGKTLMVKTRVKLAEPKAPVLGSRAGEKRLVSTDANAGKADTIVVEPSVPPAQ